MRPGRPPHGFTTAELTVALALGVIAVAALAATTAVGTRVLARLALRAEAEDIAQLAVEAFGFDVRRAGFDPAGAGFAPLALATDTKVTLHADLDRDGVVAATSEETTSYVCNASARKLSRVIGSQSQPLANDVVTCAFAYVDAAGATLAAGAGGLDAAARRTVRRLDLDLAIAPPGSSAPTARHVSIALRSAP